MLRQRSDPDTPNVDRLASEGVRYETAVSNFPICMPARSILLSGQYNRTCTGSQGNVKSSAIPGSFGMPEYPYAGRPHLKDPTFVEILRDHRYRTSVIGKLHIHSWPGDIGFDHYLIPRVHHCHTGQSFTQDGGPEFVPWGIVWIWKLNRWKPFFKSRKNRILPFFSTTTAPYEKHAMREAKIFY